MMAGALFALFGVGVMMAGLVGDSSDDTADADPPAEDETDDISGARDISLLSSAAPVEASDAGEIFEAVTPRGPNGQLNEVIGFDPENDTIAFNITDLAENSTHPDGTPYFAGSDHLSYDVTIADKPIVGGTLITLTLFDASDAGADPLHVDVLLHEVTGIGDDHISVVDGDTDLSETQGGERVGEIESGGSSTGYAGDSLDLTRTDVDPVPDDDVLDLEDGPGSSGGDGDDLLRVGLGTDVSGDDGADSVTIDVSHAPEAGLPLFLWNQPVEDARFDAHSWVTLDDDFDSVHLTLDPAIGGQLHQVTLTQESFGTSSSEVFTHQYTLILWTPDGVTDIADLVSGGGSAFNGSLAQDSEIGEEAYEIAANDPMAPRVILTVDHGTAFSGWIDDTDGSVSGAFDRQFDLHLTTNREIASLHEGEIY